MSETLDTLLDINQLDSGHFCPDVKPFPLAILLESVTKLIASDARMQVVDLRVVPSRCMVSSDPRLLLHILRNLVSNAVKYTAGKVLLGCRRDGDMLRIEVLDNGIGIPETQLQPIFEEFHQIDNPNRERGKGLGLGLSIVLRLATILGHKITVRSQTGRGSTFSVTVPLATVIRTAITKRPTHPCGIIRGGRQDGPILIIEDDPTVRNALTLMLERAGYRTITAEDSDSAQAAVKNAAVLPGIMITDYNLRSNMDGLQAVACLRALAEDYRLPAIILTADISDAIRQEAALLGYEYIRKPVLAKEIIMCIKRLYEDNAMR